MTPIKIENFKTKEVETVLGPIPFASLKNVSISCWQLNKEELEELNKTGVLFLINYAQHHPAIEVTTFNPFISSGKFTASEQFVKICFSSARIYNQHYLIVHLPKVKKLDVKYEEEKAETHTWLICDGVLSQFVIHEKVIPLGKIDKFNNPEFIKYCLNANKEPDDCFLFERAIFVE